MIKIPSSLDVEEYMKAYDLSEILRYSNIWGIKLVESEPVVINKSTPTFPHIESFKFLW